MAPFSICPATRVSSQAQSGVGGNTASYTSPGVYICPGELLGPRVFMQSKHTRAIPPFSAATHSSNSRIQSKTNVSVCSSVVRECRGIPYPKVTKARPIEADSGLA